MSRLTSRVERDLREISAGADPSPSAWESIAARLGEDAGTEVAFARPPAPDRSDGRGWITVAAAAFVVLAGAIAVLTRVGDEPSTSPADLSSTTTFVSPRNGFSVEHPDGATVTPATQLLGWSQRVDDGFDVVETGSTTVFKGASTELTAETGVPIDDVVDDYLSEVFTWPGGCGLPRREQAEIAIDGQAGRISECSNRIEATVVAGGRLYLFSLSHDGRDARDVFDAFAATIDLTPDTALDIPGLTTTFVSPTNGVAFGAIRGIEPASGRWNPDERVDDMRHPPDQGFDMVETGLGAVFLVASTTVPDGVSIDEWVDTLDLKLSDDSALPRSGWERCLVPRGQQDEVTIDGEPGRVLECPSEILATVVAGGRLYLFTLLHSRGSDARVLFDDWLATIDLRPEDAAMS